MWNPDRLIPALTASVRFAIEDAARRPGLYQMTMADIPSVQLKFRPAAARTPTVPPAENRGAVQLTQE